MVERNKIYALRLKLAGAFLLFVLFVLSIIRTGFAQSLPEPLSDADYHPVNQQAAELGRLLFYDPVISGNRNISCASCHHHDLASGDGLSLGIGEGGIGLGPKRTPGTGTSKVKRRVPRNASALFNLGAKEFTHLFHDGRVSIDPIFPSGFNTPAEEFLPDGLKSLLAVQALFPLTSAVEMAGERHENEIAGAARRRADYVWPIVLERIRGVADYLPLFQKAYPEINGGADITIVHYANAIADFINAEWRSEQSPFDRYLRGDKNALNDQQLAGMKLFYGDAGCNSCHSGKLQTDHKFHALMLPHFGPGRTRRFTNIARDAGRLNESDRLEDSYRFRTPSLRNVTATAPYGHNGAYRDLRGIIQHHLTPEDSLKNHDASQLVMPNAPYLQKTDFLIQQDKREMARMRRYRDIDLQPLTDRQIDELIAFLGALTDQQALYGRMGAPKSVPSGLPVD